MVKRLKLSPELPVFILFLFSALYLSFGKNYSYAVKDGVSLWVATVFPALFPYLFITAVLSSLNITGKFALKFSPFTRRVFNCGGLVSYSLFFSVISGYPVGAKTVADLKENNLISGAEAVRASALCSTASPTFLISCVGTIMFNSRLFGILLFICHILSAFLTGFIFSFYKRKEKPTENTPALKKCDNILYDGVYMAVISVLIVGGLITVFYLFTEILFSLGLFSPFIKILTLSGLDENTATGIIFGLFECTKGLKRVSLAKAGVFTFPIVSSLCGFGGLSVIAQSLAYLKRAKIKTAYFILSKILSAVINFIIGFFISLLFLS